MTIRTILVASCVIVAGCASRQPANPAGPRIWRAAPTETDAHHPAVGATATAAVGDSIVAYSRHLAVQTITLPNDYTARATWKHDPHYTYTIRIPAGTYQLTAKDSDGASYFTVGKRSFSWIYKGTYSHDDDVLVDIRQHGGPNALSVAWVFPGETEITFTPSRDLKATHSQQVVATTAPRLRRELIYTGRTGNALHLLYREFVGDMARPAFSQALQYDIGTEPVIGYQGARFRVLAATNTSITYVVDAPLPTPP